MSFVLLTSNASCVHEARRPTDHTHAGGSVAQWGWHTAVPPLTSDLHARPRTPRRGPARGADRPGLKGMSRAEWAQHQRLSRRGPPWSSGKERKGPGPGMHWKGGRQPPPPPPPGRPAYAQPLFPRRQVPASMAFVTDSNRPQPLWQPPPTACLTASRAASEAPFLLMHPCPGPSPPPLNCRTADAEDALWSTERRAMKTVGGGGGAAGVDCGEANPTHCAPRTPDKTTIG